MTSENEPAPVPDSEAQDLGPGSPILTRLLGAVHDLSDRVDSLNLRLVGVEQVLGRNNDALGLLSRTENWGTIADRLAVTNERLDRIERGLQAPVTPRPGAFDVLAGGLRRLADVVQPRGTFVPVGPPEGMAHTFADDQPPRTSA